MIRRIKSIIISVHSMADSRPRLDPSPEAGDVFVRWKKWTGRFKNLMIAINVTEEARQKVLLLHYAGEEINDIFDTLEPLARKGVETETDAAMKTLTAHFGPKQNREFEVYIFRQAKQTKSEEIAVFLICLRQMAAICEFTDPKRGIKSQLIQGWDSNNLRRKALSSPAMSLEQIVEVARSTKATEMYAAGIEKETQPLTVNKVMPDARSKHQSWQGDPKREIKSQLIQGCDSNNLRRKALSSPAMSLEQIVEVARATEAAKMYAAGIEKETQPLTVNKVMSDARSKHQSWQGDKKETPRKQAVCHNCGQPWPHRGGRGQCAAYGKKCRNCGKLNHFSSVC